MTAPSALDVLRIPARLILTPTDLSAVSPYGGTELGMSNECAFEYGVKTYGERAQEWGGVVCRLLSCGDHGLLVAQLRSWNKDAIGATFPSYALGASGAPTVVSDVNASVRAGQFIAGQVILMAALAPEVYPSALLYNALPRPDIAARMRYSREDEARVAVVWECAPDSSGRTYAVGRISDLSL